MMLPENFESDKNSSNVLHESLLSMPLNIPDNKCLVPVKYIRVIQGFLLNTMVKKSTLTIL